MLFFVPLIVAILTDMRCFLIMVLIFISLMISYVEHLFICLLVICISSLESGLLKFFAYFQSGFFLLLLSCRNSLYILDINPFLIRHMICKYFLSFQRLFFPSVDCFLWCTEVLGLMLSCLSIFAFVACIFCVTSKRSLPNPMSWCFFSLISIVL